MSKLCKSLTLAAVAGLWASSALAAPINWADTTTRVIAVLSEDSQCESKSSLGGPIVGPPYAFPSNAAATAGCTVFQNSGSAIYDDSTPVGPNDFKATLSKITCSPGSSTNDCAADDGNWWRMDISAADEFDIVNLTVSQTAGATLLTSSGNGVMMNIVTGEVKPPLTLAGGNASCTGVGAPAPCCTAAGEGSCNVYYAATLNFASTLNLDLIGKSVPNDAPFFGTSSDISTIPTTDGVPLTFSCVSSQDLGPSNPTLPALGPYWVGGLGTPGPGGADAICGPGPFPAQPGFNTVSMSGATAFAAASLEFLGAPANDPATSPAWGTNDWKFEEAVDPDGDGVVSGATTLGKQFILDNCQYEPNAPTKGPLCSAAGFMRGNEICTSSHVPLFCCTGAGTGTCTPVAATCCTGVGTGTCDQSDSGGVNTTTPDLIGDACQCGDTNNSGTVTGTDRTVLSRALVGLSPYFSVASGLGGGGPGLDKCNVAATVTPGVAGCTGSDATVIGRAVVGLSPGIKQGCDAANP